VVRDDGTQIKGFAPVCENFAKPFCHLTLKDGIKCDSCEHKKWAQVTDETVSRHVTGEEVHTQYVLQKDGTIKFGAIDFDFKSGREDKGYTWEDVSRTTALLAEWGIPHGIARSTGNGFHIYFFFEDFYPAARFRALVFEVYERLGFMELLRQGAKYLPEVFPKQTYVGRDGIGNGITPPMIEPNFARGKNCFVDSENKVIGAGLEPQAMADFQWKYLQSIPVIPSNQMDDLISRLELRVLEEGISSQQEGPYSLAYANGKNRKKWNPPLSGSIEKVLEGCSAFRKVRDKALKGVILGHNEGFALYHMSMATADGLEWFKKNVPGWGQNERDLKQLQHSHDKSYSPWSCKALQEKGICPSGTACFSKQPPREVVDGIEVIREDIPKEQWPEPSPVRYAYGKGEDYLLKLLKEADELSHVKSDEQRLGGLRGLAKRIQVFDGVQQKDFKEHLKKLKVFRRAEMSKVFAEAEEEHEALMSESAEARDDVVKVDDNLYKKDDFGYSFLKPTKGNKTRETKLCSVDIEIREERVYQDESQLISSVYRGVVRTRGFEREFEISVADWHDNTKFVNYFAGLLGTVFSPIRQTVEYIRQAATGFSRKRGTEKSVFLVTQGYYDETYLMPSVIVDREGVRPNTSNHVDLGVKQFGRELDFSLLTEEEFKDVMLHIKTDLISAWPKPWVYTGLAHALLPALVKPLEWNKKATLFYEGLTGSGKTELTHTLQYFWGNFQRITALTSTGKALMEVAHEFKDALLVCDDYKGLDKQQIDGFARVIQYSYDGNVTLKLRRDSTMQKAKESRAVLIMSGEEFITNEASMVARTILIEVDKYDTRTTRNKYLRVEKMRKYYRGVTPRFISWALSQNREELLDFYRDCRIRLKEKFATRQNADRVAQNLAINHTTWNLWTRFMLASAVATLEEVEELNREHWEFMVGLQRSMIERCEDEQNGVAFIRVLKQLISTGELSVKNMVGYDVERKPVVGYLPESKDQPGVIYIYPDIAYQAVLGYTRNSPIRGTERAISRQLHDIGVLKGCDKGRLKKQVRTGQRREFVWVMDLEALGFESQPETYSRFQQAKTGKVLEFKPGGEYRVDAEGIF